MNSTILFLWTSSVDRKQPRLRFGGTHDFLYVDLQPPQEYFEHQVHISTDTVKRRVFYSFILWINEESLSKFGSNVVFNFLRKWSRNIKKTGLLKICL